MFIRALLHIKLPIESIFLVLAGFILSSAALSMEEESISIIGNNELPSAQFIIPWKDSASPMTPNRPVNSLINQSLMPVDPDIFRRKINLYNKAHITD